MTCFIFRSAFSIRPTVDAAACDMDFPHSVPSRRLCALVVSMLLPASVATPIIEADVATSLSKLLMDLSNLLLNV